MRLLTCKQSTENVCVLATGDGEVTSVTVYNPSSEPATLQLRAYDKSKDLNIGLAENTIEPLSTLSFMGNPSNPAAVAILNSGDELSISGNSQGHNLHYTYGFSGSTNQTFVALQNYDTTEEDLAGFSFTPPNNILIKSFNTTSSDGELTLEANVYNGTSNKRLNKPLKSKSSTLTPFPPFESWDSSTADNEVAHPFDLCIYTKNSSDPEYRKFRRTFAHDAWCEFINRTAGTADPVNLHLQFVAMTASTNPTLSQGFYRHISDCGANNNIYVDSVTTGSNGKVTDVDINIMIMNNGDWVTPGYRMWNDGTFLNEDGTRLPMQNLATAYGSTTCPAGGIGWSGSLYGSYPCYPKDATATGYLKVQLGIGENEYTAGWGGQPRWNMGTSVFREKGQSVYSSSFVPYDPVRGGYWLDLGT